MRVPFVDDMPAAQVKSFAGLLTGIINSTESQVSQNSLSVKDQLCAFITAEFFQRKTAWPIDNDMKNHISVTSFSKLRLC